MNVDDDEQGLLERWHGGEGEAFGVLFERYASPLYGLACRLSGSADGARDLVQNAVLRALRSRARCRTSGAFHAWMRRIVVSAFLDQMRFSHRRGRDRVVEGADVECIPPDPEEDGGPPNPREQVEETETRQRVEQALAGLPDRYRAVVVLCDIENLSYAEIAETLSIPVETVRTRLRRARTLLRSALRDLREPDF